MYIGQPWFFFPANYKSISNSKNANGSIIQPPFFQVQASPDCESRPRKASASSWPYFSMPLLLRASRFCAGFMSWIHHDTAVFKLDLSMSTSGDNCWHTKLLNWYLFDGQTICFKLKGWGLVGLAIHGFNLGNTKESKSLMASPWSSNSSCHDHHLFLFHDPFVPWFQNRATQADGL